MLPALGGNETGKEGPAGVYMSSRKWDCLNYRCYKREDKPVCRKGCSGYIGNQEYLASTARQLEKKMIQFNNESRSKK